MVLEDGRMKKILQDVIVTEESWDKQSYCEIKKSKKRPENIEFQI